VTPFELPESVFHYVIRARESVILDDASLGNLFSQDEYIHQRCPRSVLCIPLVRQAKLIGALYLENNFAPGAFTPDRLAMLKLLASQAAISLDHARLYADLIRENNVRRKAEEALRASEERWSKLAENSSAGIALIAPDGRFIAANMALQKMLGYTEDELQGSTASSITHEEDRADTEARLAEACEGRRRVYRIEKRYLRKDGGVVWADVSTVFVPSSGSSSGFFSSVIVDITERKRAESEIRQLNASLEKRVVKRTIELEQSNDKLRRAEEELRKRSEQLQKHRDVLLGLAHSDKSNLDRALRKICSASAAALDVARVSYWSLRENGSVLVCEVLHLSHTESFDEQFKGTRLNSSDCPICFEALAARQPVVADRVLQRPSISGLSESHLKQHGISSLLHTPVWLSGEVVGLLCHEHIGPARHWSAEEIDFVSRLAATISLALEESARARSEHLLRESEARLRESEERLSAAFRASPQCVTILRACDEKFIEANDAFVRWYGADRHEILGHNSVELSIWVNLDARKKFFDDLRRHGSQREIECLMRSRRGTVHTMMLSADIIEINREQRILTFFFDITQRKQAEAELLRTLAREKELGQLRTNFVSMVSHEFRTPLGIIQSSAEILEDYLDQLDPAERREYLQSIHKHTRRMALLMEEVLLIGSLDAGKTEFKPGPLELGTFVRRLVDEVLSATAQRCPIELLFDKTPAEIQADQRLLGHIFTNLLTNAVKYSDAGRAVRFDIELAGTEMLFAIRDQGIGIPEADREWLFNPFHRGHNVSERPGTGLGLVIVKRCVDLHSGKIKVESKLGEGTTVLVSLPI
jgi:PAS domain S-box-containing protein